MFGSGRNSSFVIQDLIVFLFYAFQKKSPEFSITWNKINSNSDIFISYLSIAQTQIKHMLPTSFKFRANSYVKSILSKTQENSMLKTRYLKRIIIEQLFIISIARDYSQSPFIQLLKIKIKENLTHLLFCLQILRSHLNIYNQLR